MSEIKEQVQSFIHKYLEIEPEAEAIMADYALKTWQSLPHIVKYLLLIDGTETGSTRAGAVMAAICRNSLKATGLTSSVALMVMMDAEGAGVCVPIIEEIDLSDKYMQTILSVGYAKDCAYIFRTIERDGKVIPEKFNVFGYKVILSRRKFRNPAIQSKCLTVKLTRMTRNDIPRFISNDEFRKDSAEIQQALSAFYANVPVS